jgi:hypothetical protein
MRNRPTVRGEGLRGRTDSEIILDAAEVVAPSPRLLEVEVGHLGMPLDLASVVPRPGQS